MSSRVFIARQLAQIAQGGTPVLFRKVKIALKVLYKLIFKLITVPFAIPVVLAIRIARPWFLVRWSALNTERIGHLVADLEIYLCERDAGINIPKRRHTDIFYVGGSICNQQLVVMWKRVVCIWPAWILEPVSLVNHMLPGGTIHEIKYNSQGVMDVHNLLDRFPPHLEFSSEEITRGESKLREIGIPQGANIVCMNVRDSSYLSATLPGEWSYHNYRDGDIQNYVMAAEELASRGYFVFRMGKIVKEAMKTTHPKIIDFAADGFYDSFLDIYLGYKCLFSIGSGTGWDMVPSWGFRKPTLFVNYLPIGYCPSSSYKFLFTTKRHILSIEGRELTLRQIFDYGVGFCSAKSDYESKGIKLVECTPEEIRDVAVEMAERVQGRWQSQGDDESLQRLFWEIFPVNVVHAFNGKPLHGEIRARFGANFLRENHAWLQ